jgi:conjugative relaxase-like TrwC/TraI family protein
VRVLAGLLDGVGPDGARLVEPVLRADPAGRVPALPIVTAARAAAAEAGTDLKTLLGSELYRHWHTAAKTLGGGSRARGIRADVAAAIARRCGLEAAAVYEANTAGGADAFRAALARAGGRVDGRRAGLDLTFSAPKSVSLLAAFAPSDVAEQVRAAHDAAVTEALGWLEPRVARAARGHHGDGQTVARVRTDGLVGVAFTHDVSRALDPQLHTHVVLANLARAGDGRWSALDTKAAYRHSRTAGHLYQAVLRAELTTRLGVEWGPVTHGTAEIVGIPRRLRRVFSKRSDAIAHQLYRAGLEGPRAAQAACLASRDPKTPIDPQELQRRWRAEAAAAKVDPDTVVAEALGQASPPVVDEQALAERLLGPSGLTEQRTWFGYDDLLQAVCTHLPAGAPVDAPTVERLAARVLAHPDTIPLNDSGEQPRWTTRDLLAVEQHALATADRLHHLPAAAVDPLLVEYALRVHGLTGEQADLVRTLTQHPGRLSVVVGPAGAGKTAALAAARTAWGHDDQLVVGCATAALAAQQLGQATGITSTTVATILRSLQDPRPSGWLPPGGVLVVDEAGMVGTRDLATLLAAAEQHHARLVLVGDPAQLPEIDAGGLFGHLARHPDAALADNRRQQADWERDALAALRAGRTGPALGAYLQHGHVHIDPTPADRTDRIVEDYLMARRYCPGRTTCSCSPPPAPTPPTSTARSATPCTPPDGSATTSSTSTPPAGPAGTPPATR